MDEDEFKDDEEIKEDVGSSLAGDGTAPFKPPEPQDDDDLEDYFDRELRQVERDLELGETSRGEAIVSSGTEQPSGGMTLDPEELSNDDTENGENLSDDTQAFTDNEDLEKQDI